MAKGSRGGLADLARSFLAFEEETRTFSREVCGPFWDWMRPAVFQHLLAERTSVEGQDAAVRMRRRRPYGDYAGQLVLGALRSAGTALQSARRYDVAVLNHWRRNVIQGKEVNMNCFPVIVGLADRYRLLVVDPYETRRRATLGYPAGVRIISSFHLLDLMKARLLSRWRRPRCLGRLRQMIAAKFGMDIDLGALYANERARHVVSLRRLNVLFQKHRPRVVIAAHRDFAAIEAAHALGIPFVELQHSMISALNIPYNYPDSVRAEHVPTLPDYVFTFGEYWNDKFSMPSQKRAVGYPFFDMMLKSIRPEVLPTERANRQHNIIIIGGYLAKQALLQTTLELSRLLPSFTIFYKLKLADYSDWRSRYPQEFWKRENIRVIDSNDTALYEYFSACAYVVGVNSGALYEGLAFGLTTFVLRAGCYEESRELFEQGHAFLVDGAEEIARVIQTGQKPQHSLSRDSLFRPGALVNVEAEITAVVQRSDLTTSRRGIALRS